MRKLLLLLSLCLLLAPAAQATDFPYPESTILSVVTLTPAQRTLADYLYGPIFRGETKITLPKRTSYDDVAPAMTALMQDYPELFHLGRDYTVGYYTHEPEYATYIQPQYRLSADEAAGLRAELYAQAWLLADACRNPEPLHDALCSRVAYGGDTEMRHTAVGALLEGAATCEGYAQALTLLYRMAGIPCGLVTGTATDSDGQTDRHSWNIAALDGYALIDATWNDQNALALNTHWYYGLSTGQMAADHTPDAGQQLPLCGDQANWHRVRGYEITTLAQADAALRRLVNSGELNLRIPDSSLYRALAGNTHDFLSEYNQRNPENGFYGAYSVIVSDAQQCVIIQRAD